jgi:membrane-associated phospholipid phosphatase
MEQATGLFENFPIENWLSKPFPENTSETVKGELEYLASIRKNQAFDDIHSYFGSFFYDKPVQYPTKSVKRLLKHTRPIILKIKYNYNRPRPAQLSKALGIKINNGVKLDSMHTPSYPSGHSTQGILVAHVLGDMFPEYRKELIQMGEDISMARLVAKAHYPTDSQFGEKLGYELYKHYKKEK